MGRTKKQPELSPLEKKYIDEVLRNRNNVNYEELFLRLSAELDKPTELIRDHANKMNYEVVEVNLPPEPKIKKVLTPIQEAIRSQFTPNRDNPEKARHVTVMSQNLSEMIEQNPPAPVKGASRNKDCIFRQ